MTGAARQKEGLGCSQIATVSLHGQASRQRHVAETDDGRLVVLETGAVREAPQVRVDPFPITHAMELAEQILAGSPRHITHKHTPLVLATTLIALSAVLRGTHAPAGAEKEGE